ncbi:MAG: toll/interleukin-1 receptor domain-containing protein [Rivularia sp. (in: cyanobacteria)]
MTSPQEQQFDVFLCHNSEDKPEVRKIQEKLEGERLLCFVDEYLYAGELWRGKIANAIRGSRSVAIFVGGHSLGQYQKKEIEYLNGKDIFDKIKLIPIILDTATPESIRIFQSECRLG